MVSLVKFDLFTKLINTKLSWENINVRKFKLVSFFNKNRGNFHRDRILYNKSALRGKSFNLHFVPKSSFNFLSIVFIPPEASAVFLQFNNCMSTPVMLQP